MTKNNGQENPYYPQVLELLGEGHRSRVNPSSSINALLRNLRAEHGNQQTVITMTQGNASKERRDLTTEEQEKLAASYEKRNAIQSMINKILQGSQN